MKASRILLATLILVGCAQAAYSEKSASENGASSVRVVAIGDIHGDYGNFLLVLEDTGLVDKRGRWTGGNSTLVQLGDVPDRGPDTLKIIEYLRKLTKQAEKAGGRVRALIGNHESMNMQGDLRYVHAGEYAAFVDRGSKKKQDRYYAATVAHIKSITPEEEWPEFDQAHRAAWEQRFPPGYVEHRVEWAPAGDLGKWVLGNDAAAKVGDSLFLHGGLNLVPPFMPLTEINTRVRTELAAPENLPDEALVNSPDGPLWNRGLATLPETDENQQAVEAMLEHYGAKRIVVGHTPILRTLLPRFGGRVIVADVGLSEHYGGATAALVLENGSAWLYQNGERIEIPTRRDEVKSYLAKLKEIAPSPELIDQYMEKLFAAEVAAEEAKNAAVEAL